MSCLSGSAVDAGIRDGTMRRTGGDSLYIYHQVIMCGLSGMCAHKAMLIVSPKDELSGAESRVIAMALKITPIQSRDK
jgi:hypothetical protein